MREARFMYECRWCHAEFWNGQDCSLEYAMKTLVHGHTGPATRSDHALHQCGKHRHGIADLIGYQIVETD
jgi:hypothetical protein